jgi:hypothetical protein
MKKLFATLLITLLSFNSYSQEEGSSLEEKKSDPYELTAEEEDLLDKTTLSYRANKLKDMYAKMAINNNAKFDRAYLLQEPLTFEEVVDFRHPYLNILISDLTESDRDAIIEMMRDKEAKYQRYRSIMLTAMKFATDSALYEQTRNFRQKLTEEYYDEMVQIFPFHMLALESGKIRAPVIEEIGFTREIESKRTRREIKKRYRIARQAEVMNEPQTYMDFFENLMTKKPNPPNVYMLPLNEDELEYWRKGVLNGWVEGTRLANEIIRSDIRMALREIIGQLRFHYLARAKIISMPTSKNINVGTNSNGLAVNIGESVFEITQLPRFNDRELSWIALPQVDDIFNVLTQQDVDELTTHLEHPGDLR